MRFLPPVAPSPPATCGSTATRASHQRPLAPVVRALRDLGADVTADPRPAAAHGARPRLAARRQRQPRRVDVLAVRQRAAARRAPLRRRPGGAARRRPLPSGAAHRDDRRDAARRRRDSSSTSTTITWRVEPGPIDVGVLAIEPDLSNAAPFLAAALVTGGRVTVPGWPLRTTQAGDALRAPARRGSGPAVDHDEDGLTVTGPDVVEGIDLDLSDVGELAPVLDRGGGARLRAVDAARHRAPAPPRDRPAGRPGHRDHRAGRRRAPRPRTASPCTRDRSARRCRPDVRRPSAGHDGRGPRAARRRASRSPTSPPRPRRCRASSTLVRACWASSA